MFDQKKFSDILNKIVKLYGSISELANTTRQSRSYFSKYINLRLQAPPTPKVLEKIAEASRGITTYDELMQVCGYLDSNTSSKEIIAQNICRDFENEIDSLHINNIDKDYIFNILIHQNERNSTVLHELSNYIEANYGNNDKTKKLFEILEVIDQKIKDIVILPNNIGIPLYSISTNNMVKVGYFPFEYDTKDYIAVKAANDKMLPLLGKDDIAVIYLQENIIDGHTLLLLIDDSYYDIAKIFSEANICKLYFMNSKSEELELSRIKVIGDVVLSQNKSAFKKGGLHGTI